MLWWVIHYSLLHQCHYRLLISAKLVDAVQHLFLHEFYTLPIFSILS